MDLIKDETDVGQVVRVTYDEGVEFLNYNDVSVNFIITTPFLNPMKRKISLDTLEDRGHDELRLFLMKVVHALQTTKFVNTLKIVSKPVSILKLLLPYSDQAYCFAPCDRGGGRGGGGKGRGSEVPLCNFKTPHPTASKIMHNKVLTISSNFWT